MIKVVLIGGSKLYREGLQRILAAHSDVEVLGAFPEVDDALSEVRAKQPDVILLHRHAFAGGDPSPLQLLRQTFPSLPIVLLLDRTRPGDVDGARQQGAASCLSRHVNASFLAEALRLAAGG